MHASHASTASSRSYGSYGSYAYAYYEADSSDEEDDPFPYETIDAAQNVRPLQLRSNSAGSSIYSLHERERIFNSEQNRGYFARNPKKGGKDREREKEKERTSVEEVEGEGEGARVSEADSRPSDASLSPALSIGSTASPGLPASPATPPPQFSKRFARSFSLRSGSHKSSLQPSMKRLRKNKKSQHAVDGSKGKGKEEDGDGGDGRSGHPKPSGSQLTQQRVERYANASAYVAYAHASNAISTSANTTSKDMAPSGSLSSSSSPPLPLPRSHSLRVTNPIHAVNPSNNDNPSASATGYSNVGPASPVISTTIPCESFFEEDDLSKLSFSIRGSLIFGGKRPWRSGSTTSHKMADRDVILEQPPHPSANTNSKPRVFPLVPSASKKDHVGPPPVRPPREDDMGVAAMIPKPFKIPEPPHLHQSTLPEAVNENTSTSHRLPPSIRVISAEAEKESQKVRSLYESGEALQLGDGDVPWPLGGTLEPPPEVPSDVDGNDAYDFLDSPALPYH